MTLPPPPSLSDPRRERARRVVLNIVSAFVLTAALMVGIGAAIAPIIP